MKETITGFISKDDGQDLIEYTLLLAFVCILSAALFINGGSSVATIWGVANSTLTNAEKLASAS